jgi:putative ABC transport system substrate-binding protein
VDANITAPPRLQGLQDAARIRGVELSVHVVERLEQIRPRIDEAKRGGAEALNVLASPILYAHRLAIYERTTALRLSAVYQSLEFAEEGALVGYGPRLTELFRQLARQFAKVFNGAQPSDVRWSGRRVSSLRSTWRPARRSASRCRQRLSRAPTR